MQVVLLFKKMECIARYNKRKLKYQKVAEISQKSPQVVKGEK